jgi:hypothetical protein
MLTPNSTPSRGGEETNRHTRAQGCWLLDTTKTPTIAKKIHREDQAHTVPPATHGDGWGLLPLPLEQSTQEGGRGDRPQDQA